MYAFVDIARELGSLGAPRALVRAAERAALEEVRHAAVMASWARAHSAAARSPWPWRRRRPDRWRRSCSRTRARGACARRSARWWPPTRRRPPTPGRREGGADGDRARRAIARRPVLGDRPLGRSTPRRPGPGARRGGSAARNRRAPRGLLPGAVGGPEDDPGPSGARATRSPLLDTLDAQLRSRPIDPIARWCQFLAAAPGQAGSGACAPGRVALGRKNHLSVHDVECGASLCSASPSSTSRRDSMLSTTPTPERKAVPRQPAGNRGIARALGNVFYPAPHSSAHLGASRRREARRCRR